MPPPKHQNLYLGKAGQFAVMAECLMRGFNVAIPEVDIGDDLFVVNDESGNYRRIQVKSITATQRGQAVAPGYSAQFKVPLTQLKKVFTPELIYVFVARFPTGWGPFLVIPRDALLTLHDVHGMGAKTKAGKDVQFYVRFGPDGSAVCSKQSLAAFVNQFEGLPDTVAGNDIG